MKRLLHVGCGHKRKGTLPPYFQTDDWQEVTLDLDPACAPDIVGTMTDMPAVQAASMDAVFSLHNLEHLHPDDVARALREFHRVLQPDGFALLCVPNIELAARMILEGKIEQPAYDSPGGPVTPLDIIYGGMRLTKDNPLMMHRMGFTAQSLRQRLGAAGFGTAAFGNDKFNVWGVGFKQKIQVDQAKALTATILSGNVEWARH